jgi:hypothetical protein
LRHQVGLIPRDNDEAPFHAIDPHAEQAGTTHMPRAYGEQKNQVSLRPTPRRRQAQQVLVETDDGFPAILVCQRHILRALGRTVGGERITGFWLKHRESEDAPGARGALPW